METILTEGPWVVHQKFNKSSRFLTSKYGLRGNCFIKRTYKKLAMLPKPIEWLYRRLRKLGYGIKIEVSYVIFERLRPLLKPRLGECLLWGLDSYEYTLPSGEAIHFEVDHRNKKC